jgi:peroxiredoxin
MNIAHEQRLLANGEEFPHLQIPAVGGETINLPGALSGSFGVILIYRGSWCPYCVAQLSAFERAAERLAGAGIKVAAFSVDDEATTAALKAKLHLDFPLGHSADPEKIASLTGAFVNAEPRYLQSTGFVLFPDGKILTAVYATGAIGRLVPDDVLGLVKYVKQNH